MGEVNKTNNYTEFYYHFFKNILLVSAPLVIISALILSIPHSSADNGSTSTDVFTLTLDVSCTINSTILEPHNIHLDGSGLHREDIGITKIGTYCNDNNGYNIYAVGSSNNTDGNTDLVVNGLSDDYNIKTGIYSSGSTISSWSMKLTAGTGTGPESERTPPTINNGYNNYNVIPNVYTKVASRPSGTNMDKDANPDVTGSYFTTTYDVYASSVQPAGTYTGKVKYVMVHPSSNHNTIPDLDTAFAAAGKMKVYEEGGNSYYAMQDMNSQICSFVSGTGTSTATQLVDVRDNNLYWVAKLDDGKCWMTSNLDLDIGGLYTEPLNSNNTDISTDPNVYASSGIYSDYSVSDGVYTWNPVSTAVTSGRTISGASVTGWVNSPTAPYSVEGGDTYYYTSGNNNKDTEYGSLTTCKQANHTETECRRYFAGNYYNWSAAIASNNSANISTNNDRATNSICPKGWRLPADSTTDNEYNEFGKLFYNNTYNITDAVSANGTGSVGFKVDGFEKIRTSPLYFIRPGAINANSQLDNRGSVGNYWSNTVGDDSGSYLLSFSSGGVWLSAKHSRGTGKTIRCVAR